MITNSQYDQLPVALIVQLVERCTCIAEVLGSIDLHLSKALFSLDPDNQQLYCFFLFVFFFFFFFLGGGGGGAGGWEHCSVVRSFVLSANHVRRFKWCRSAPWVRMMMRVIFNEDTNVAKVVYRRVL